MQLSYFIASFALLQSVLKASSQPAAYVEGQPMPVLVTISNVLPTRR